MHYAVNNLYGDPCLPSQVGHTVSYLHALCDVDHTVIITRLHSPEVENAARDMGSTVFVTLSNNDLEKSLLLIKQWRNYENVVWYLRPLIGKDNLELLIGALPKEAHLCLSGFRASNDMLLQSGISAEGHVRHVKFMPSGIKECVRTLCQNADIYLHIRTSCAYAHLRGKKEKRTVASHNFYIHSAKWSECVYCSFEQQSACWASYSSSKMHLQLIRDLPVLLGENTKFDIRYSGKGSCTVEQRESCNICCTVCNKVDVPRKLHIRKAMTLPDLSFLRNFYGIHACADEVIMGEDHVFAFPHVFGETLPAMNTWLSLSKHRAKCLDCGFCVLQMFPQYEVDRVYGRLPHEICRCISDRR